VVVKQPEPVRPYTGTTSYKAYKEYFEKICVCNDWKTPTEYARHLLVAMGGAASEAVRGLKAEQDSDLATIWEALARRFGFVDKPERAMRRFDVRKQLEGETLAVFEQSLRMLHREAWPKTDIKSSEADSLLRRKFVDGILDMELQRHLRVHAAKDDFATTVSKARQFLDASELTRTVKKPAIRTASPSVNFQSIVDGVLEALSETEAEWRRSIQPRRLTPVPAVKRPHLARDRRRQATHLRGALPAVRHPPAGLSGF